MSTPRHLNNAPIREALIDIAVKLPKETDLSVLRALRDRAAVRYPKTIDLREAELELVLTHERNQVTQTQKPLGYRCETEDGRKIVQFRLNGFTYNWLHPYETWENLRDSAQEFWRDYCSATKPVAILRVGLRYINNLEFPFPFKDFKDYLTALPNIPPGLPDKVTRFLSRVSIAEESSGSAAIVTQAFEGFVAPKNKVTVILDIDTSKRTDFASEEEVWQALEVLHTFKNEIFFNSLTPEAQRLFE